MLDTGYSYIYLNCIPNISPLKCRQSGLHLSQVIITYKYMKLALSIIFILVSYSKCILANNINDELISKAINGDKASLVILTSECFNEEYFDTKGYDYSGLHESKQYCAFYEVYDWIKLAADNNIRIAQYAIYKRFYSKFTDANLSNEEILLFRLRYLNKAYNNGLEQAIYEYGDYFAKHQDVDDSGVDVIRQAISTSIDNKKNPHRFYRALMRIYALGINERQDFKKAKQIHQEIREKINNNKYISYFDAVSSNFFGIEDEINYELSLKWIYETPKNDRDYQSIRIIEAIHHIYGLNVEKNIEKAFLILDSLDENQLHWSSSNLLFFLKIICIIENESLDLTGSKINEYKRNIFNSAKIYLDENYFSKSEFTRDINFEKAIISLTFDDYIGTETNFLLAHESEKDKGTAAYA